MNRALGRLLMIFASVLPISFWTLAQQPTSPAAVVIEATSTMHFIKNYTDRRLWVRLTKDGKVEWEESLQGKPYELHSAQVSPKQLVTVEQDLNSVDWGKVHGRMGPYNAYIDTSVEVRINALTTGGNRQFSVVNPWPGSPVKPMPPELKRILCELDDLHAQATGEPPHKMCLNAPTSVR